MALHTRKRLFRKRSSFRRRGLLPVVLLAVSVGAVWTVVPDPGSRRAALPGCDSKDIEPTVVRLVTDVAGAGELTPQQVAVRQTGTQATGPTVTTRSCVAEAVVDDRRRTFRFDLETADNALGFLLTAVDGPVEAGPRTH